jgi:uncharacterized protein YndB with AHSA1/START domain
MWTNEASIEADAPAEAVWRLFQDPSRWVDWHPDITDARLDGELAVGSEVRVEQRGAPTRTLTVVAVQPGRSYATEDSMPLSRLRFEHEVQPLAERRCRILLRQTISGPLAPVFSRLLGKRIARGVPEQLDHLAQAAEREP